MEHTLVNFWQMIVQDLTVLSKSIDSLVLQTLIVAFEESTQGETSYLCILNDNNKTEFIECIITHKYSLCASSAPSMPIKE